MTLARTSHTHPLQIAAVQLDDSHGRIGITFCPGKHDSLAATGRWARDLDIDLAAIQKWGAKLVLTLIEPSELIELNVSQLGKKVEALDMVWKHLPIADYSVPDASFEAQWLTCGAEIRQRLKDGQDILVHCKGGLGRAGMIAARLLAELGMEPEQAIRLVRKNRPGAIETKQQEALVTSVLPITDEE